MRVLLKSQCKRAYLSGLHLQLLLRERLVRNKSNIRVGVVFHGESHWRGLPQRTQETSAMVESVHIFVHPHPSDFPRSSVKQIPGRRWGRGLGRPVWASMARALSASASAPQRAQRRLRRTRHPPSLQNVQEKTPNQKSPQKESTSVKSTEKTLNISCLGFLRGKNRVDVPGIVNES